MVFEQVETGNHVKVWYKGTLEDGSVFDSTEEHGEPLEFDVGRQQMIPGFEKAMMGMKVGEEKKIHLTTDDAYGNRDERLVQKIPLKNFPKGDFKEEQMLMLQTPDGYPIQAVVKKLEKDTITLDMNHPLAGKALNFQIKLLEISEGGKDTGCGCGCDSCGEDHGCGCGAEHDHDDHCDCGCDCEEHKK